MSCWPASVASGQHACHISPCIFASPAHKLTASYPRLLPSPPLSCQVFANIAIIIMDEESPSVKDWFTWRDVFHLVDIICCCAILFPIVWSIKHLREASQTDGKAARNLEKLQLFRQFYIMVVVYIYFTRIVVYLLRSTMEYQYEWVSEAADQVRAAQTEGGAGQGCEGVARLFAPGAQR